MAHDGGGLEWLPDDGVVLTRVDLERIFVALRALIIGIPRQDAWAVIRG
jgi:hypothetical protein